MTGDILQTDSLTIGYRQHRQPPVVVARNIDVTLAPGELVCLIGPNGAGKSTLMRTLAGMQPALAGQVRLDGRDVHTITNAERARLLSVVLTEQVDVGSLSVYALVALGRYPYTDWSGVMTTQDEQVVQWAILAVGAQDLAGRHVGELSDGERQKVMIARALAQEPAVMLLDEPTAFLDLPRRVEIMQMLRQLARETGRAVLLSTHDLDLALRSADRIWLMPYHAPVQVGAPEDLVLTGAFEAAFQSEGVIFDRASGSFRIAVQHSGEIVMRGGDSITQNWTQRALERAGFAVIAHDTHNTLPIVEIINGVWRLHHAGEVRDHPTLHALVAALALSSLLDA